MAVLKTCHIFLLTPILANISPSIKFYIYNQDDFGEVQVSEHGTRPMSSTFNEN